MQRVESNMVEYFNMNRVVEEASSSFQHPIMHFINAYQHAIDACHDIAKQHGGYNKTVSSKLAQLTDAFDKSRIEILQTLAMQSNVVIQQDIQSRYSALTKKIIAAQEQINQIESGARLRRWQRREKQLDILIKDLKTTLSCCKTLQEYKTENIKLRQLDQDLEQTNVCYGRQRRLLNEEYEAQLKKVTHIEELIESDPQLKRLKELSRKKSIAQKRVDEYTHSAHLIISKKMELVQRYLKEIETLNTLIKQKVVTHLSDSNTLPMNDVVKLYAMMIQFKNQFDHEYHLVNAIQELDAAMSHITCDSFHGLTALQLYSRFIKTRNLSVDTYLIRNTDIDALEKYTNHTPTAIAVNQTSATFFASATTTKTTTQTENIVTVKSNTNHAVAESTLQKRSLFAASKNTNGTGYLARQDHASESSLSNLSNSTTICAC